MKVKKLYYMECRLAGRQYHDIDKAWDELHYGDQMGLTIRIIKKEGI